MNLALVSTLLHQSHDPDLPLLVDAAARRGVVADVVPWDAPDVDWSAYDAIVVRSCWDYVPRREEFLAWAASVPRLHNRADVIAWNTDKTYLRQLERAGVPIIETRWDVGPGDEIGDHAEWVVKPAISAGSRDTARWSTRDEVWAHSAELVAAGCTSMTQPYVASVDGEGETAMLHFNGELSHAIRKGPMLERGEGAHQNRDDRESITPRNPSDAQREVSAQVIEAAVDVLGLTEPPLYARVDLVTAEDGQPVLIELELAEPSMFLPQSEGGADRFVDAILARI